MAPNLLRSPAASFLNTIDPQSKSPRPKQTHSAKCEQKNKFIFVSYTFFCCPFILYLSLCIEKHYKADFQEFYMMNSSLLYKQNHF